MILSLISVDKPHPKMTPGVWVPVFVADEGVTGTVSCVLVKLGMLSLSVTFIPTVRV